MEKTGFHEDFINGAGKTVTTEIFFYIESEPSDKQILYLPEGSEEILIFHRNILADEPVPHHAAGRKRCGNVDQALIFGAAECKADVFLSLDKFPINEDIDQGKHLIRAFAPSAAFGQKIRFQGVAGIAPDCFTGILRTDFFQERNKRPLVIRFKRFSAQQGQSVDIIWGKQRKQFALHLFIEWGAVGKAPGFWVETVMAVMSATGDEKGNPHALSVCNITVFDCTVVHYR